MLKEMKGLKGLGYDAINVKWECDCMRCLCVYVCVLIGV
jgi:hypothetical protein